MLFIVPTLQTLVECGEGKSIKHWPFNIFRPIKKVVEESSSRVLRRHLHFRIHGVVFPFWRLQPTLGRGWE